MEIHRWLIVFMVIIISLTAPVTISTYTTNTMTEENNIAKQNMTTAAYDGMASVDMDKGYAFKTNAQRVIALNGFYKSLAASYGLTNSAMEQNILSSYIPFVAMVDNDGIYICYNREYNNWASGSEEYDVTSPITYSETYNTGSSSVYIAQFKLDNSACIYKNGNLIASGNWKKLHSKINSGEAYNCLPFLASEEMFKEEKQSVVTNVIGRTIENYMNSTLNISGNKISDTKNNAGLNSHNAQYVFTLPRSESQNWARAISGPTIISFYQGTEFTEIGGTSYTVQFALTGSDIGTESKYYVGTDGYYHLDKNCNSTINTQIFYSAKEAAAAGYSPCPKCIK